MNAVNRLGSFNKTCVESTQSINRSVVVLTMPEVRKEQRLLTLAKIQRARAALLDLQEWLSTNQTGLPDEYSDSDVPPDPYTYQAARRELVAPILVHRLTEFEAAIETAVEEDARTGGSESARHRIFASDEYYIPPRGPSVEFNSNLVSSPASSKASPPRKLSDFGLYSPSPIKPFRD